MRFPDANRVVLVALALVLLSSCGGARTVSGSMPDAQSSQATRHQLSSCPCLYVPNSQGGPSSDGIVTVYPAGSSGNVAPSAIISGSNTQLSDPIDVALDPLNGDIYVTNADNAVTIYAPGSNGNVLPVGVIEGKKTKLDSAYCLAFDPSGNIYVANALSNTITVYSAGSTGNVAPVRVIKGGKTKLESPTGIALDSSLNIYVANYAPSNDGGASVTVYAAGATGNVAPMQRIRGHATKLEPYGVAVDSNNDIYVSNGTNSITVYGAGTTGNVAPIRTIKGGATELSDPLGIVIH